MRVRELSAPFVCYPLVMLSVLAAMLGGCSKSESPPAPAAPPAGQGAEAPQQAEPSAEAQVAVETDAAAPEPVSAGGEEGQRFDAPPPHPNQAATPIDRPPGMDAPIVWVQPTSNGGAHIWLSGLLSDEERAALGALVAEGNNPISLEPSDSRLPRLAARFDRISLVDASGVRTAQAAGFSLGPGGAAGPSLVAVLDPADPPFAPGLAAPAGAMPPGATFAAVGPEHTGWMDPPPFTQARQGVLPWIDGQDRGRVQRVLEPQNVQAVRGRFPTPFARAIAVNIPFSTVNPSAGFITALCLAHEVSARTFNPRPAGRALSRTELLALSDVNADSQDELVWAEVHPDGHRVHYWVHVGEKARISQVNLGWPPASPVSAE